ncbi:MAG: adenine phosphoribosyltransferase [Herpetosiphonaceae bacterium]|nr:adenine phosphoribosyltransferase [Herpetosiphonaceae bacterium]
MPQPPYADLIRNVPDFPLPGVQFKDITTLLQDGPAFYALIDDLAQPYLAARIDVVVGVESRGFLFAAPVAYKLGAGLVLIRKPGKLPAPTVQVEYSLEYGTNTLQMHQDAIRPGARVLIVDDVLATGGTVGAAAALVRQLGGEIVALAFPIELTFLQGRASVAPYPVFSLVQY